MSLTVNERRCPANHRCPAVFVCPVGAIKQNGYGVPEIIEEKCINCMKCTRFCPMGAIQTK